MLASAHDMGTAAARIPGASYVPMNGSHFIQLERPEEVHRLLLALVARVG
jgi:pimeloyl-ACP methyl ester carboxylesterase